MNKEKLFDRTKELSADLDGHLMNVVMYIMGVVDKRGGEWFLADNSFDWRSATLSESDISFDRYSMFLLFKDQLNESHYVRLTKDQFVNFEQHMCEIYIKKKIEKEAIGEHRRKIRGEEIEKSIMDMLANNPTLAEKVKKVLNKKT